MAIRGATRQGDDSCGGAVLAPPQSTVYVNGKLWAVVGTPIAAHGEPPHTAPSMSSGSTSVYAESISACRAGDS